MVQRLVALLREECDYIEGACEYLGELEPAITARSLPAPEFYNRLGDHELRAEYFLNRKEGLLREMAGELGIRRSRLSLKLLVNMGYPEIRPLQVQSAALARRMKRSLLKVSVFVNHYHEMTGREKQVNQFLNQTNYSLHRVPGESAGRENILTREA